MKPHTASTSAQRIRVGLTGLAFAFLVILLGSIVSRSSRDQTSNSVTQVTANEHNEPLADLGVAPGAAPDENSSANKSK